MKHLFLAISVFITFQVVNAQNDPSDVLKDILSDAANSYKWKFSMVEPSTSDELKFTDQNIILEFIPMDEKQMTGPYIWSFWFTNNSSSKISINWEKTYLTSLTGKQRLIYHGEIKYISNAPQENTVVESKERIGDAVVPKESVVTTRHEGYYDDYGKWVDPWNEITNYQVFFGEDFPPDYNFETVKTACEGKSFKLHLSLVVGGSPKAYDFIFKVKSIDKNTSSEPNPFQDILNKE